REYASRMNAGPSRGGAGRPEKRVNARSMPPQKKFSGLHLLTKLQRADVSTRPAWMRIRQKRFAYSRSYEWCPVPSSNRVGDGTSTGIDQIFTGIDRSESAFMTSR